MIRKFDGGVRRNVIPSACKCTVIMDADDMEKAGKAVADMVAVLKEENRFEEPGLKVECKCDDCTACSIAIHEKTGPASAAVKRFAEFLASKAGGAA